MKLEFLGADHEVTGSCHFLEFGEKRLLVDCGMEQGADLYVNQEIPVNPAAIDYVFLTHAHIDHSGLLPLIYAHGFRGQVFATKATCELCGIMLRDSAHIQMFEAEWKNRKGRRAGEPEIVPLYTMEDAEGALRLLSACEYGKKISVDAQLDVRFVDAGHLLGSSSIEMWVKEDGKEVKIAFSGDIGHAGKPLIKNPEFITEADYVVMESTYGDKNHAEPPDFSRELAAVIDRTFARGGNVVIPAFSVGRTQEMLYFLRKIKTDRMMKRFLDFEVYIDSPLAVDATGIFHKNVADCFDEEALSLVKQGINPIGFPGLKMAITSDESRAINFLEKPVVIISASGMCEAGRIRHQSLERGIFYIVCRISGSGDAGACPVKRSEGSEALWGIYTGFCRNLKSAWYQRSCGPRSFDTMGFQNKTSEKNFCGTWGRSCMRPVCRAFGADALRFRRRSLQRRLL